jgi:hypothetical protein
MSNPKLDFAKPGNPVCENDGCLHMHIAPTTKNLWTRSPTKNNAKTNVNMQNMVKHKD